MFKIYQSHDQYPDSYPLSQLTEAVSPVVEGSVAEVLDRGRLAIALLQMA